MAFIIGGVFMIFIPLVILLILYFVYCLLMRYESRTLWSGVGFFGLSLMTILTAFFYAFYYSETLTKYPLIMDIGALLVAAAVLVILFFPLATIIMFFVEGIKVIKHEGLKFTNLLSLGFAIGLFVYLFIGPLFLKSSDKVMTSLYAIVSFTVFYLLSVLASYCLSAFINTFHLFEKRKLDYIIVLGAGIKGEQVTPLLASRIDKGIEILKRIPKPCSSCLEDRVKVKIFLKEKPWHVMLLVKALMRVRYLLKTNLRIQKKTSYSHQNS